MVRCKRSKLLFVALFTGLMCAVSGGVWAQNLTVKITKQDASTVMAEGKSTLQEALDAIPLGDVKELEVSAGTFNEVDWEWLKGKRSELTGLMAFAITEDVASVADIPDTEGDKTYFGAQLQTLHVAKVERIGKEAFCQNKGLRTASFPQATSVGSGTFSGCSALTTVDFPKVTSIGNGALLGCEALGMASFPQVSDIGEYAFSGCNALVSVNFPQIARIGARAFYECTILGSIHFPRATSIGEYAFSGCTALASADLPQASDLGKSAFLGCEALVRVNLAQIKNIGENALSGCVALRSLVLPGELPTASEYSFGSVSVGNGDALKTDPAHYCYLYVPTAEAKGLYESHAVWGRFKPNIAFLPTSIELSGCQGSVLVGESFLLIAKVLPAGTLQGIVWSSDNAAVATVDATGVVTAVAAGKAIITATSVAIASVKAECTVEVRPLPQSVVLGGCRERLMVGESFTLTASVLPDGAPQGVTWSSSDERVATVDATGRVTAASEGKATISAVSTADAGVKAGCTVEVKAPIKPTEVRLHGCKESLVVGESFTLTASVLPDGALQGVTWSSSDEKVATVDASGKVTAVSEGKVTISATSRADAGVKAGCTVVVKRENGGGNPQEETPTAVEGAVETLTLAPNPAVVSFRIVGLVGAATVRIVDARGVVVGVYRYSPDGEPIEISHLSAGVYTVVVRGVALRLLVER